jgi:hypothetical protein
MNNIRKRIARNIRNQLGLDSVAGAGGGKGKGTAGGEAYLKPPQASDLFQSISYLSNLDLICEGPVEGLVKKNGEKALGLDVLEAVYYNDTPIKSHSVSQKLNRSIRYTDIQNVDRINTQSISESLDNITGNLNSIQGTQGQFGNYNELINGIENSREDFLVAINQNKSFFSQFGFIQFDTKNIFESGSVYLREKSEFSLNISLGEDSKGFERYLKSEEGLIFKAPEDLYLATPSFMTGNGQYISSAPAYKVGDYYPTSGFHGGGFIHFYIGDNVSTGSAGEFLTGKFLVAYNDTNISEKIQSGIDNGYDVFVYSGNDISFAHVANQSSPAKGSIIGEKLNTSLKTDEDSQFNYINANVDYNLGSEFQPKLSNYSKGFIQTNINQQLFGRFRKYAGDAQVGDGNEDTRGGRRYASWQVNLPTESDAYGYTHTIQNQQITKATPTVMISSLSDTEDNGEDVGKTLREFIEFEVIQGFEGDEIPFDDRFFVNTENKSFLAAEIAAFEVGLNASNQPIIKHFIPIQSQQLSSPNSIARVLNNTGPTNGTLSNYNGIYVDDQDGNLQNINKNSVLTNFGINSGDNGALFFNIVNILIIGSGLNYTGISTDLAPEVLYTPANQLADFNAALTIGTNGIISGTAANFDGGLYRGVYEVEGEYFLSNEFSIHTDIPNSEKTEEGRLEISLTEGIPPKEIYLAEYTRKQEYRFEGVITSPYMTELDVVDLPQNKDLNGKKVSDIEGMTEALATEYSLDFNEDLFPNDSWKNINRYIKIYKKTYETESVLISRDASIAYITEEIPQNFTYPFSALVGSVIDARSFNQAPDRTFEMRLKKCAVPSNYQPLFANGTDKRFVSDSSKYGLRNIQTFNGSTHAAASNKIDLGTQNCEFLVKVKFGSFVNWGRIFDGYVNGHATEYIALWYQNQNTTHGIQSKILDGDGSPNYVEISIADYVPGGSKYNADNVFEISLKLIGTKQTLTVWVNGELVGTSTEDNSTTNPRKYLVFDAEEFCIGGDKNSAHRIPNGSKIADLKIKKNNQLLHHWDGTVVDTPRGQAMRDRFGGNHAIIEGTSNAVEDTNFEFGPNKEQVYIGEWDGSFKLAWTDNPAWILYDLMTNHSNGLGDYLDDMEDIDIFHLYEMGRYCDSVDDDGYFDGVPDATQGLEPRFSANFILQEQKNAFEVIGEIASLFRAMTYWNGGFFNFSIDNPKNVQAIFNNGNVFDGVFNYADIVSSARFTRVEVPYLDKDDNYKVKVEYVEDEEKMRKYGKRVNKQTGFGLTSKSQARRMAKYILFSNQFETEAVSFSTGPEAVLLAPGDIIQIEDEIKNFEINYGKILDVNTSQGYLDLENSFKTGSIVTGENGGLYTYNNKQQTDVKALYNLIKFDRATEVGVDENIYSGVVPLDKVGSIDEEQITKFIITGIEEQDNSHRVYIDQNDQSYDDFTGVIKGSFFNIELENRDTNFFKVVKITEEEANKYNVNALEYQIDKFTYIEQEDFDLVETQYNIGVPTNTINRPPEPLGFTDFLIQNEYGSHNLTGTITGELGGNELKYRVSLIYPNGKYTTHEFLKDVTTSPPKTDYEILNLSMAGDYTVNVTSLRNPESSKSVESNFRIDLPAKIREHFLIKSVNIQNEYSNTYSPEGLTGQGSIVPQTKDYIFKLKLEDMRGGDMAHNPNADPSLDIYINDELYKQNYKSTTFRFSHEDNLNLFGNVKRNLNIKFELKDKNQKLHHTAQLDIMNTAPIISNAVFNPPKVNFDVSISSKYDLEKINIYNLNTSGNLEFIKTEFLAEGQRYINLPEASDTDVLTLIPFDHYGSGIALGGIVYEQPEQESASLESQQSIQSFDTVYICKGTGELITQDLNNQRGIFWQSENSYIIKGSFNYVGSGSYNTDFYVGQDKIFNTSGQINQSQKTIAFMEFVSNQSGFKEFSLDDESSGATLQNFFFEVDKTT